jgi:hypothetical protein
MANNAPAIPVVERLTVPASAMFSDAERTLAEIPASHEADTSLPAVADPAKPAAAVADPAKPAATVVADPAKPAATVVADPAKPAATVVADPAKPAATAPEAKIKIGDKEYTREELEKALVARAAQPAPAAAAPVAAAPVVPPTPEQIATAESAWCEKFIMEEKLINLLTEKEMESVLAGDKDGITILSGRFNSAIAKAVMLARKSIYQEINPILGGLQSNMQPVLANAQQVEAATAEHQFFTAYPDFKGHADTVRRVGEALLTRFPNECRAMTREQLLQEVAAQSDRIIQEECSRFAPGKNWRQLQTAAAAPVVAAAAPVVAAAAPVVKAPGANSPAAVGTGTDAGKNWHKETAASLSN